MNAQNGGRSRLNIDQEMEVSERESGRVAAHCGPPTKEGQSVASRKEPKTSVHPAYRMDGTAVKDHRALNPRSPRTGAPSIGTVYYRCLWAQNDTRVCLHAHEVKVSDDALKGPLEKGYLIRSSEHIYCSCKLFPRLEGPHAQV